MFSVILVCLENFQEYILTNIAQLLRLGHTDIYILTNEYLFSEFEPFAPFLKLIDVDKLDDLFKFKEFSTLDKTFRGGFWFHTSARFFVIHAFMLKYGVKDVIHIENDVLLYYDANKELVNTFTDKKMYIPFDTYERNIASILYIPDADIFGKILEHYDFSKNDMYNFSEIRKKTDLIQNLPIFVSDSLNLERAFVTNGFKKYIFDAAAIGQLIGGVDPRNAGGDTRGFVNETCIIKYKDEGNIVWKEIDGFKKPFINTKGVEVPIFNLHIHCKDLSSYC
jgi:hypothetical protein